MKVLARLCNAVIGASLLLTLPQACATQNEGERCDKKNGNADCDNGLLCTQIDITGGVYAVCCYPLGGTQNTSAPCLQSSGGGIGGTGGTPNTADAAPDGGDADTGTE